MIRRRIARLLGLTSTEAELLIGRAQRTLSDGAYALRTAAFLLATTPLLRRTIPLSLRQRLIRPLVHLLLPWSSENLLYARAQEGAREPEE